MSISTLITPTTTCTSFKLQVNDIDIPIDDVITVEFKNSFFEFGLNGIITIKDSFSLINSELITFDGSTTITLTINDFFRDYKKWIFTVVDMKIDKTNPRVNNIIFIVTDVLNYKLTNTYISKSFNTNIVSAFAQIFDQYKYNEILSQIKLITEFNANNVKSEHFTISSNINLYDFFKSQFRLNNVRIFQDNYKLYVKQFKLSDIKSNFPIKKPNGNELNYTNMVCNNDYAFKIHDYLKLNMSKSNMIDFSPLQEVIRFNNKTIDRQTVNLTDFYNDLLLNNNDTFRNLQDTAGKRSSVRVDSVDAQKYDLFNTFIQNEGLQIVVPGNIKYNNVGYIVKVKLSDKSSYKSQQLSGDITGSGLFLVTEIRYKFFKDIFIQRMTLNRFDSPKALKS